LEGLDNLHELNVLSVGKNKIGSHETAVTYLRSLKNKLEVLKMAENPFNKGSAAINEIEYKQYVIAYLKDLKYLDYELIEEDTREKANEKHKEDINENESKNNAEKKNDE
jgi:hypothetical protein